MIVTVEYHPGYTNDGGDVKKKPDMLLLQSHCQTRT